MKQVFVYDFNWMGDYFPHIYLKKLHKTIWNKKKLSIFANRKGKHESFFKNNITKFQCAGVAQLARAADL